MKKTKNIIILTSLVIATALGAGAYYASSRYDTYYDSNYSFPVTKFGAYLAAQHAVYVNDFDNAQKFIAELDDVEYDSIKNSRLLIDFLSGTLPDSVADLEKDKTAPSRIVYDTYLVKQQDWEEVYKRHKKDTSALSAPIRIWSSVAINHRTEALNFIQSLPTNNSWKDFITGQIYAELGNIEKATEHFKKVSIDFLNINDYLYLMSFYKHNNLEQDALNLQSTFTMRPGGMYMIGYNNIPDWSNYAGFQNALAFSMIQNVSHTQIMMYSDLSLLFLRFAQIIGPAYQQNNDAINYYLGQFFYNNVGDFESYFDKIEETSPFYLFSVVKTAEKNKDISKLHDAVNQNPLFVPAVNKLIAFYIQNGNKRQALKVVNKALEHPNLPEIGHSFFLKSRAQIYFAFDDLEKAQQDLHDASALLPLDPEIMALQAKIWAKQNRDIENAYAYAMALIKQNPADVFAWDTVGVVVYAREGLDAAIEILAHVAEVATSCSSLFEHLGDMYVEKGDFAKAKDAYSMAIDLSDDGLVIVPNINKKLRNLK